MQITSPEFAVFTLAALLVYYLLPPARRTLWLLVVSYVFLAAWEIQFALVFAVLTGTNYLIGQQITRRVWALRVGILINLLALAYFKYANFFLDEIGASEGLKILLPVGLSFYVVQAVSYLLDIRQGIVIPETRLIPFALYMAYFPRVTAGPIERARDFLPRLERKLVLSESVLASSLTLILVGLVRKVALADTLNILLPEKIFETPKIFHGAELILWLLAYAFLIYNDFAGYTSIIRGVSLLFGIELSSNFNVPYFSRNFAEFWQRWHITLSNWLRDYVFSPTLRGLLRRKYPSRHPVTLVLPPMLTMLLSALWHEAALSMLLWGGLHGLFQVVERVRSLWRPIRAPQSYPRWRQGLSILLVFMLTVLAWVPFRMPIRTALDYWKGMITRGGGLDMTDAAVQLFFLAAGLSVFMDFIQYRYSEMAYLRLPSLAKAALMNLAVILIVLAVALRGETPPPFIYQSF
ncbi:MAG: hypothetical protein K8I82_00285 [Anaerolineae bacterium]|nr:hypothetical protein [Anaerolineae bacterium]